MGGPVELRLKPRGKGDQRAEEDAEFFERAVTDRLHEAVELAQGERRNDGDEDEGAVGAENPQGEADDGPESDGAEGAFNHGVGRRRSKDRGPRTKDPTFMSEAIQQLGYMISHLCNHPSIIMWNVQT